MGGRAVFRFSKKLFIYVCLVMIVFSNFISVLPVKKVYAYVGVNPVDPNESNINNTTVKLLTPKDVG